MDGCGRNSLIIHQCAPLIDSAKPKGVKAEAIMQRHTGRSADTHILVHILKPLSSIQSLKSRYLSQERR